MIVAIVWVLIIVLYSSNISSSNSYKINSNSSCCNSSSTNSITFNISSDSTSIVHY